jgi:hypothetical protein
MPEATLAAGFPGATPAAKPRKLLPLLWTIAPTAANRVGALRSGYVRGTPTNRIMLGVELIFGVLPISVVGGFYALLGIFFGMTSVLMSISQHSLSVSMFWLAILAIAVGGLIGIIGLWLLVLVSELGGTPQVRRAASVACSIGIATAVIALTLAIRQDGNVSKLTVYLLVSPIVVVCERLSRPRWSRSA